MSTNEIYEIPEIGRIRWTLDESGTVWFAVKDIANILGHSNGRMAAFRHIAEIDRSYQTFKDSIGRNKTMIACDENGLYSLVEQIRTKDQLFKESVIKGLIDAGAISKREIILSRNEIEFKAKLEQVFKIASDVVSKYIDKDSAAAVMEIRTQYPVLNYRIDFYLPFFNLAIEYDEHDHEFKCEEDKKRQAEIEQYFESEGKYVDFVRVREGNEDAAIGEIIGHLICFAL